MGRAEIYYVSMIFFFLKGGKKTEKDTRMQLTRQKRPAMETGTKKKDSNVGLANSTDVIKKLSRKRGLSSF